ncbi:hypothetical protein D9M71_835490 [compost metagenome]
MLADDVVIGFLQQPGDRLFPLHHTDVVALLAAVLSDRYGAQVDYVLLAQLHRARGRCFWLQYRSARQVQELLASL